MFLFVAFKVRGLAHTERIPMCGGGEKEREREKDREQERDRERDREREREREGATQSGSSAAFSPASSLGMFPPPSSGQTTISPQYNGPLRLPQLPHLPHISFTDRHCSSPLPRRKQVSNRQLKGIKFGARNAAQRSGYV